MVINPANDYEQELVVQIPVQVPAHEPAPALEPIIAHEEEPLQMPNISLSCKFKRRKL
jgi:hypothetical protein